MVEEKGIREVKWKGMQFTGVKERQKLWWAGTDSGTESVRMLVIELCDMVVEV